MPKLDLFDFATGAFQGAVWIILLVVSMRILYGYWPWQAQAGKAPRVSVQYDVVDVGGGHAELRERKQAVTALYDQAAVEPPRLANPARSES